MDEWLDAEVIRPWKGPVGTLKGGRFEPLPASPTRYIAPDGMRSIARHLEHQLRTEHKGVAEVRLWSAGESGGRTLLRRLTCC